MANKTYSFNGTPTVFQDLPKDVQRDVKAAEAFYSKTDASGKHREKQWLITLRSYISTK